MAMTVKGYFPPPSKPRAPRPNHGGQTAQGPTRAPSVAETQAPTEPPVETSSPAPREPPVHAPAPPVARKEPASAEQPLEADPIAAGVTSVQDARAPSPADTGVEIEPVLAPPGSSPGSDDALVESVRSEENAEANRALDRRAVVILVAFYVGLTLLTFNTIEEDAFIYFRVVENILGGHGYVFNRGAAPVEVGSSVLWVPILALAHFVLPFEMVLTAKLVGVAFGIATIVLVARWAIRLVPQRPLAYLAPALVAASSPFLMYNQRGLESSLYTFAVVLLASVCTHPVRCRYWVLPMALAMLSRSEGFILCAAAVPMFIYQRLPLRNVVFGFVCLAALMLAVTAWRYSYFHDLQPNPFYLKATRGRTWVPLDQYFSSGPRYYLLAAAVAVSLRRGRWTPLHNMLLAFLIVLGWFAAGNVELKPFSRHLSAFTPIFYVFVVVSLGAFEPLVARSRERIVLGLGFAVIVATLIGQEKNSNGRTDPAPVASAGLALFESPLDFTTGLAQKMVAPYERSPLDALIPDRHGRIGTNYQSLAGDFFRANYPAHTVIVYDQMGQTPYRAGADKIFIDSFGLCDRVLGHRAFLKGAAGGKLFETYLSIANRILGGTLGDPKPVRTDREALDYLFAQNPSVIVINRFIAQRARKGFYRDFINDPLLQRDYERKYLVAGWALVWEKRGLTNKPPIQPEGVTVVPMTAEHLEPLEPSEAMKARVRENRRNQKQKQKTETVEEQTDEGSSVP